MFQGRKASIQDLPFLLVFTFILGIVIVSGSEVFDRLNNSLGEGSSVLDNNSATLFSEMNASYARTWDSAFMFVVALFGVALIISTTALGTRPEFFFILMFISMFLVGVAAVLSNIFAEFSANVAASENFTFINLFLNNLVEVFLVLMVLLLFGLYVKIRGIA